MADTRHETELVIQSRVLGAQRAAADFKRIGQAINDPSYQRSLRGLEDQLSRVNEAVAAGATSTRQFGQELRQLGTLTREIDRVRRAMAAVAIQQGRLTPAQASGFGSAAGGGVGGGSGGKGGLFGGGSGSGVSGAVRVRAGGAIAGVLRAPFLRAGVLGPVGGALGAGALFAAQVRGGLSEAERALALREQFQGAVATTGGLDTGAASPQRQEALRRLQAGQRAAIGRANTASAELRRLETERDNILGPRAQGRAALANRTGGFAGGIGVQAGAVTDDPTRPGRLAAAQRVAAARREAAAFGTAERRVQTSAFGEPLNAITDFGARFGLRGNQAITLAQQAASARRGRLTVDTARSAILASRFGAGGQTTGLLGAQARLGGRDESQFVADQIGAAVSAGLEGSQIAGFLQTVANNTQALRDQGIAFDDRAFARLTVGLSGVRGVSGEQALGLARNLTGGARQLGLRGAQSPLDILALRTLGGARSNDPNTIAEGLGRLEEGRFAEGGLSQFIQRVEQFSGARAGSPAANRAVQQALSGIAQQPIGRQLTRRLTRAVSEGRPIDIGDVRTLTQRDLEARAGAVTDPTVRARVQTETESVRSADRLISSNQALADAQRNLTDGITRLSAQIEFATRAYESATAALTGSSGLTPLSTPISSAEGGR